MGQSCIEVAQKGNRASSAGGFVGFTNPGALPQVRHGESVSPADESVLCADLWRTSLRPPLLALNHT